MRVLLANKFFYPRGGDCIHTMQLKDLLEKKNHQVAVFSMQYSKNLPLKESIHWPKEISFSFKSPGQMYSAFIRPFGVNEVKDKFSKLIEEFKPDILHVHNIHSQLSPVINEVAKRNGIPVVWTLHDYKLICPAYTFLDNELNVCEDCVTMPISVLKKKCIKGSLSGSLIGYLEAQKWNRVRLESAVNQFISPSAFLKTKMVQSGFNEEKLVHLYNFVDDLKFEGGVHMQRSEQVVYVGRLSKEKGVETLCKAFSSIKQISLRIIGDGPEREDLESKYSGDNISFLGFRNWDYIKNELGHAAFLVIPSEWYENNPLTIIEALATGTPVLGAQIGGITELINKDNGMLFTPRDVTDLKNKVIEMIKKDDWLYEEIKEQATRKFSQEHYYTRLMELYSNFI